MSSLKSAHAYKKWKADQEETLTRASRRLQTNLNVQYYRLRVAAFFNRQVVLTVIPIGH